ncbi:hypothetical protein GCM10011386_02810 [Parapedobacter defluvii]|uniref:Helix-turn-helix domain-containing protein n=1 Tax=Parapedobacter defluvii TaxID=2045106 RepID=A0ABQ1L300_9SPHI|nr:helix-turn-helix domain-containing protein [Parapedobacter defluvii]GGC14522.1 hypothetical protein GCM10011386_02810 [Parapedobacter defluvii]
MRCRAVFLKADGLSSAKAAEQTDMSLVSVNAWVKRFALKQHNELFEGITGVDISHPFFAHINWKPEMIDEWKRLIYPHT